jgi:GntR family transcriptional repressor for pyruvate dehydrogenase complex
MLGPSLPTTTRASSTPTSATTLRAHRTVTNAIQAQDPEAAGRRMSRHVYSYAEAVMEVEDRTSIEIPEN